MTRPTQDGPASPPQQAIDDAEHHCAAPSLGVVGGELSSVGVLCADIMAVLDATAGCPKPMKIAVAARINGILEVFSRTKGLAETAAIELAKVKRELRKKKDQLDELIRDRHGEKSEKSRVDRSDESEPFDSEIDTDLETVLKEAPKGKRALRISKDVPIIKRKHYPDDKVCGCGCNLKFIENWRGTESQIVPEHVQLTEHIHYIGVCGKQNCKESPPVAKRTSRYIMKGCKLSLDSVLTLVGQKFHEHSTVARAGRRIRNQGLEHANSTINRSIIRVANAFRPLHDAIANHVNAGEVVHADETPMRVRRQGEAKQKGPGKCDRHFLFAFLRDERKWNVEALPAVAFHVRPSRSSEMIKDLLAGTAIRILQTDGYAGYNFLFREDDKNFNMSQGKCWAHTRRYFEKAKDSPLAAKILSLIRKMYAVEEAAAFLTYGERAMMRQMRTLPLIDAIEAALIADRERATGRIEEAINYTLAAFDPLKQFIYDGRLEIDNNPVERCIRGVAITRKNSLYAGSAESAAAWAIYFSLIETAKLNDVDPFAYLRWVGEEIERCCGDLDYATLMPWHCPVGRKRV